MYNNIHVFISENGIMTITLNRPKALNALNIALLDELNSAFQEVYENPNIKAVLVTGEGEKAFAAGADITELQGLDEITARKFSESGQEIFQLIENCPKPVLAAINGFALGGGCELAMACHIRFASENAKFGQPEINLGIIPGYGGTQRLTRYLGKSKSMELHLTGQMISSSEAFTSGLVSRVFPNKETLINEAEKLLGSIAKKAPFAIEMIINSINSYFNKGEDGFQTEANGFARCTKTEDFKEGVDAFLEKRKPEFKGK